MFENKFYGDKKIVSDVISDEKTYLGNEKVELSLENDEKITIPILIAKKAISDEKKDLTDLVQLRIRPSLEMILGILTDHELTIDEISYMMPYIVESVNMNIDKANEVLWKKSKGEKTLLDVDKILLPHKYENSNIIGERKTRSRRSSK